MKKVNTFYWIVTGLFAAFMLFTAAPEIMNTAESLKFMRYLGYPDYFNPFIGVAKVLGCIAILVPGFPGIKEWAYAGLTYDLTGATYSLVAVGGLDPSIVFMLLPLVFCGLSYYLYHKKKKLQLNK